MAYHRSQHRLESPSRHLASLAQSPVDMACMAMNDKKTATQSLASNSRLKDIVEPIHAKLIVRPPSLGRCYEEIIAFPIDHFLQTAKFLIRLDKKPVRMKFEETCPAEIAWLLDDVGVTQIPAGDR